MRPSVTIALLLGLGLSACGTPQEQCIYSGTKDLRVLDRLIAAQEVDVARGYRMAEKIIRSRRWEPCHVQPQPVQGGKPPPVQYCFEPYEHTIEKPVAIDIDVESRKLASMREKRKDLARQAEQTIAQCKAAHPE